MEKAARKVRTVREEKEPPNKYGYDCLPLDIKV